MTRLLKSFRTASETQRKDEERAAKRFASRDAKQKAAAAFAAQEFTKLNLEPRIMFSQTFQAVGASAEVKGKERAKIMTLYKNQQWLDLINLIMGSNHTEYPQEWLIRQAAELLRKRDFQVVITSPVIEFTGHNTLVMVVLKDEKSNPVYVRRERGYWEKHPDGTGFIYQWSANEGRPIFGVSDSDGGGPGNVEFYALMKDDRERKKGLDLKLEIGELDQAAYDAAVQQAIQAAHVRGEKWALGL